MTKRLASYLAAIACAAAIPSTPHAQGLLVEGYGGYQGLQSFSTSSVSNATKGNEGTAIVGGDVLAELGGLGLGVNVDKTVTGNFGQPWAGSILAGLILPITIIRLEVLGELGRWGSSFGDVFNSNGATFVGVRPGVRFRFAALPVNIGAAALIRWPTSNGDFGSPTYGFIGRLGFEIP